MCGLELTSGLTMQNFSTDNLSVMVVSLKP